MATFQLIQTQEEIEFDQGYDAYYAGTESFHGESPDFREGYKQRGTRTTDCPTGKILTAFAWIRTGKHS